MRPPGPVARRACASGCWAARSIRRMTAISMSARSRCKRLGARLCLVAGVAAAIRSKPRDLAPLAVRVTRARLVARHPRIIVIDIEQRLGTRYTIDTLTALQAPFPAVSFVWLMGSDNLEQFSPLAALAADRAPRSHRGGAAAGHRLACRCHAPLGARVSGVARRLGSAALAGGPGRPAQCAERDRDCAARPLVPPPRPC